MHEIPSELMNEVIENFNLKPNFFKELAESHVVEQEVLEEIPSKWRLTGRKRRGEGAKGARKWRRAEKH